MVLKPGPKARSIRWRLPTGLEWVKRDAFFLVPYWEGGGAPQSRARNSLPATSLGAGFKWRSWIGGLGIPSDATTAFARWTTITMPAAKPMSVFMVGVPSAAAKGPAMFYGRPSSTFDHLVMSLDGPNNRADWFWSNVASTGGFVRPSRVHSVAFVAPSSTTVMRLFVDGALVTTVNRDYFHESSFRIACPSQSDNTQAHTFTGGHVLFAYATLRAISDMQVRKLHEGWREVVASLREPRGQRGFVPAVAPGATVAWARSRLIGGGVVHVS